jgi:AraC family transcriptional regulator
MPATSTALRKHGQTQSHEYVWRDPRKHHQSAAPRRPHFPAKLDDVCFDPADLARREVKAWPGLTVEVMRLMRRTPFRSEFCGAHHLLIDYERAVRDKGETLLEGVPGSTLHDFSRKLTFVPAGHRFRESQDPRVLTRATYIHIDPCHLAACEEAAEVEVEPRLFFDCPVLRHTSLKLTALIESGDASCRLYAEALGVILAHEVLRLATRGRACEPERGGLAGWQRRAAAQYIEDHLTDQISLAELASVAQLSPYHFARAFKQTFGIPPHRYQISRRIERAKAMLARPGLSVTNIALELGFSDASSFTRAFRRVSGWTPIGFRRTHA